MSQLFHLIKIKKINWWQLNTVLSCAAQSAQTCCMIGCWAGAVLQLACSDQWPQPGPATWTSQTRAGAGNRRAGGEGSLQPGPLGARLRSHGIQSGARNKRIMTSSSSSRATKNCKSLIIRTVLWEGKNTCDRVMQQTRTEDDKLF